MYLGDGGSSQQSSWVKLLHVESRVELCDVSRQVKLVQTNHYKFRYGQRHAKSKRANYDRALQNATYFDIKSKYVKLVIYIVHVVGQIKLPVSTTCMNCHLLERQR